MENGSILLIIGSILLIILYIALTIISIVFLVKMWKACNAVVEIKEQIKDMSYRDTTRYVAEINKGVITEEAQKEAQKIFKNEY